MNLFNNSTYELIGGKRIYSQTLQTNYVKIKTFEMVGSVDITSDYDVTIYSTTRARIAESIHILIFL